MSRKRPTPKSALALSGLLLVLAATAILPVPAQQKQDTLYQRLGGYDKIAAVVDDFIARMGADPQLTRFSAGFSKDSKKRRRQLVVDQLCEAAGGPCIYIGRDMKAAHQGLAITEAEWNAVVHHLTASLDRVQVPSREKGELLAIFSASKADIVGHSGG